VEYLIFEEINQKMKHTR